VVAGRPQWQMGVVFDSADARGRLQLPAGQANVDQYHRACTSIFHSRRNQVTWGTL